MALAAIAGSCLLRLLEAASSLLLGMRSFLQQQEVSHSKCRKLEQFIGASCNG